MDHVMKLVECLHKRYGKTGGDIEKAKKLCRPWWSERIFEAARRKGLVRVHRGRYVVTPKGVEAIVVAKGAALLRLPRPRLKKR